MWIELPAYLTASELYESSCLLLKYPSSILLSSRVSTICMELRAVSAALSIRYCPLLLLNERSPRVCVVVCWNNHCLFLGQVSPWYAYGPSYSLARVRQDLRLQNPGRRARCGVPKRSGLWSSEMKFVKIEEFDAIRALTLHIKRFLGLQSLNSKRAQLEFDACCNKPRLDVHVIALIITT